MSPIRQQVIFRGQVQGVFFRATTAKLAQDFAVSGWVQNLPDGTVEMQAQGQPEEIARLCEAIGAAYATNIDGHTKRELPCETDDDGFSVRY